MKRAAKVFEFETRPGESPLVERIWRTRSEPVEQFISVASSQFGIVVTRQNDRTYLTVRGPETLATTSPIPEDADFFGITFRLGTFMPAWPAPQLVDSPVTLPEATLRSFWLTGSAREFPDYGNADGSSTVLCARDCSSTMRSSRPHSSISYPSCLCVRWSGGSDGRPG